MGLLSQYSLQFVCFCGFTKAIKTLAIMKLSNKLKKYRTNAGLTQADLADLVQVSRKTINTVENGVFVPSTILSLSIAKILNQPVEEIFFLEI